MTTISGPVRELVANEFDLEPPEKGANDAVLFNNLCDRIAHLLAHEMESFMSLMYRLDVSESKIKIALSPQNPELPNVAMAHLIIERQTERMYTKKKYQQKPLNDWMDFD